MKGTDMFRLKEYRGEGKPQIAFTLAEVLITLAIIGVIAAMTVPVLINKYNEKVTVTKVKKAYNILLNAYKMVESENGAFSTWINSNDLQDQNKRHKTLANLFKPYMRVVKECGKGGNCLANGYIKSLTNIDYNDYNNMPEYKVVTSDNMIYQFYIHMENDTYNLGNIKVYTNGKRKTHVWGKDAFVFWINETGVYPDGLPDEERYPFNEYCRITRADRYAGFGCTAWVVKNENMDYLHCNDLSWNGKHSCKD